MSTHTKEINGIEVTYDFIEGCPETRDNDSVAPSVAIKSITIEGHEAWAYIESLGDDDCEAYEFTATLNQIETLVLENHSF